MEDKLIKILRELKRIESDPAYSRKSRTIILSSRQNLQKIGFVEFLKRFQSARFTIITEVLSVLLVTVLIGAYYTRGVQNKDRLVVQANELNDSIQLKLNEIKYLIQDPKTLNASKTVNLGDLLFKATLDLKEADASLSSGKIESSIERIKSAEKNLKDIESALQSE